MPLNQVTVRKYSIQLANELQVADRKLKDVTQEVTDMVVGESYTMKYAAPFDLKDRGAYHSNIDRIVIAYRPLIIPLKDKTALVSSDIFEQALVNASEINNMARQSAMALARQQDQIIINGFNASTPTHTVTAASNLNLAALLEIQEDMDNASVPEQGRYIMATPSQKRSLLSEEEVTSSDYNTIKALVRGEVDTFLGFKFIWIPTGMTTGGLEKVGAIRKCYAWQQDVVGTVYGLRPTVDMDWDVRSQSHLVVPRVRMGSTLAEPDGAVLVNCTEA